MTIAFLFFAAAFYLGWSRAARRAGTRADKLQFGFAHAIPAGLLGLLLSVIAVRMGF